MQNSHSTNPHSASKSCHLSKTSELRSATRTSSLKNIRSFYGNRIELENFKNFLTEQKAGLDFYFWQDIEIHKQLAEGSDDRRFKAEEIFRLYVNEKYFLGPNSPATKKQLEEVARKYIFINLLYTFFFKFIEILFTKHLKHKHQSHKRN